jgi:hypothetical protein
MIASRAILACLPGLLAVPLLAQPLIGGGTCSTASLNGTYSASLSARDVNSSVTITNVEQSVGTVVFDGQNKVTFTLTTNTGKFFRTAQTLSGTYTMQANCVGSVSINSGDTATYGLASYNSGKSYLMSGQDGVYSINISGSVLPATCPTSVPTGVYAFNGSGFDLASGQVATIFNISGLIQINGTTGTVTAQQTSSTSLVNFSATGALSVASGCLGSVSLTDSSGNSYNLNIVFTSATGSNFTFVGSGAGAIFTASGRPL